MNRKTNAGFTLIELMIVVAIIGVLAVLAIFGVSKYLKNAKTAEATNTIGAINQLAVNAYTKESTTPSIAVGNSTSNTNNLCPNAAAVPIAPPANVKYTAKTTGGDYVIDPGWQCLGFNMNQPQYFNYQYSKALKPTNAAGVATPAIPATGWGVGAAADFNGDAKYVEFLTGGDIQNGTPITSTSIGSIDLGTGQPF